MKYDVITFGSSTSDTFLRLNKDNYQILKERAFLTGKALCFSLGSKIFIKDLEVFSGGGGTNTACTFANQGFKTAYVGKVGDDKMGESIIEELKNLGVFTSFLKKDTTFKTAFSVVLSSPHGERTILVYRGACHFMETGDIPWKALKKAKWFYIAPLSEKSARLFEPLVKFAREQGMKIAANPGNSQISLGEEALEPILAQVDVLILNIEEASLLTEIPMENEGEIIRKLASLSKGIVVVTKGSEGSIVFDGKYIFEAGISQTNLADKTGAGDAYGSGFVSGLLQKNDVEYAIQLATANAASCIQEIGAKNGLLKKDEWGPWLKVKVRKRLP